MKGLRPWSQFLTYCNKIANTDGTELRAAQLKDDRFDAEIEKMLAEAGKETPRPSPEGDTAVVRALRDLANDIRLLIRLQTNADIPLRLGPETAIDRIESKRKDIVRAHLSHLLD